LTKVNQEAVAAAAAVDEVVDIQVVVEMEVADKASLMALHPEVEVVAVPHNHPEEDIRVKILHLA